MPETPRIAFVLPFLSRSKSDFEALMASLRQAEAISVRWPVTLVLINDGSDDPQFVREFRAKAGRERSLIEHRLFAHNPYDRKWLGSKYEDVVLLDGSAANGLKAVYVHRPGRLGKLQTSETEAVHKAIKESVYTAFVDDDFGQLRSGVEFVDTALREFTHPDNYQRFRGALGGVGFRIEFVARDDSARSQAIARCGNIVYGDLFDALERMNDDGHPPWLPGGIALYGRTALLEMEQFRNPDEIDLSDDWGRGRQAYLAEVPLRLLKAPTIKVYAPTSAQLMFDKIVRHLGDAERHVGPMSSDPYEYPRARLTGPWDELLDIYGDTLFLQTAIAMSNRALRQHDPTQLPDFEERRERVYEVAPAQDERAFRILEEDLRRAGRVDRFQEPVVVTRRRSSSEETDLKSPEVRVLSEPEARVLTVSAGPKGVHFGLVVGDKLTKWLAHIPKQRILHLPTAIGDTASLLRAGEPFDLMAIGITGRLDSNNEVVQANNHPWVHQPLREPLERRFGLPVVVVNDAAAMSFAEVNFRKTNDLVGLVVDAGLGACVYWGGRAWNASDGQPIHDYNGQEIGLMPTFDFIDPDAPNGLTSWPAANPVVPLELDVSEHALVRMAQRWLDRRSITGRRGDSNYSVLEKMTEMGTHSRIDVSSNWVGKIPTRRDGNALTAELIMKVAADEPDDPLVQTLAKVFGRRIGEITQQLFVNRLGPMQVAMSGSFVGFGDPLFGAANEYLALHRSIHQRPTVVSQALAGQSASLLLPSGLEAADKPANVLLGAGQFGQAALENQLTVNYGTSRGSGQGLTR